MSWQNVLALAVFVGVCGFIAYWGDLLGRRMGKRRLSLFGLRPRYTAIFTTTITGMLIAIFTITVMAVASKQVRLLALRGAVVLRNYQAARESYAKAAGELKMQRRVAAKARREAEEATIQRGLLAAEIERVTGDLNKLRSDLHRNEAALARTEKQLAGAQTGLAAAKREIANRRSQIAEQKVEIERLEAQRSKLVALFREDIKEFAPRYIALRERTIIFHSKEEIARRVIRCAQPKLDIRKEVSELLDDADRRAKAEGARVGDNGRTVQILPVKMETDSPGNGRFVKESETIDAIVDQISSGSGSVVARVVSLGNSVEGEQALVDFVLNYNERVYSTGDEVARTVIDGGASRGQVLGQVIGFLRGEVRSAAMHKGVIPSYDETQGQPSVGEISGDQLMDLVDRINAAGTRVSVKAVAGTETWSAGPLVLDFVVGEAK